MLPVVLSRGSTLPDSPVVSVVVSGSSPQILVRTHMGRGTRSMSRLSGFGPPLSSTWISWFGSLPVLRLGSTVVSGVTEDDSAVREPDVRRTFPSSRVPVPPSPKPLVVILPEPTRCRYRTVDTLPLCHLFPSLLPRVVPSSVLGP